MKGFLTGVWEGPESVWRRKGRPVGLSRYCQGSPESPHASRQDGRWTTANPRPRFGTRFIREESIWSDPEIEGTRPRIYRSIGPLLQAEMNRCAESSPGGAFRGIASVSAPMPTTPTPAPVTKSGHCSRTRLSETIASIEQDRQADSQRGRDCCKPPEARDSRRLGERLCLERVRAIITYGANRHYQAGERKVEQSLQSLLRA